MNLDDLERFKQIDKQDMLAEIDGLPDQLQRAWEQGQTLPVPGIDAVQRVVIAGMGGSAIAADLLSAFALERCAVPCFVHRDYGLPGFAKGKHTLVIASSHSGNTEETLDAFEAAVPSDCTVMALCTGGELQRRALELHAPVWNFEHAGQPRAALGYSFGLLLALFARLKLIADPSAQVTDAVEAMKRMQAHLRPDVPAAKNPAKRYAGQLMGRWVTVMGAGLLAPVARRWKTQINEIAKTGANYEILPEADHNTLAGTLHPDEVLNPHTMTMFLRAPSDHPRNRLRADLTRKTFMLEGMNTDFVDARGKTPLAHMWTLILFGDYMAYYLAMANGVDPTPVQALAAIKTALKDTQ
jgi:glucose/mannose-6-phosphate isomerase